MSNSTNNIRKVNVTRYVTPLREGGSLPAITEADDGFLYVLKFRGAGQGRKALIAELLGGEIARTLGLRVPEIVFAQLDEGFGQSEADEEIQDLLKASTGLNLALHYLSGAISYDPVVTTIEPLPASRIVWLDAFITNMDRTTRNTNMLSWNKQLWLIDHGAALYFHHSAPVPVRRGGRGPGGWQEQALRPFELISKHVLLPQASEVEAVDKEFRALLTDERIVELVSLIPEEWLEGDSNFTSSKEHRLAYVNYLQSRLAHSEIFVKEIANARQAHI